MCCEDNIQKQTKVMGPVGAPIGFEVPVNFLEPGGEFTHNDVLGAIYKKLGIEEDEQEVAA